MIQQVFESSHIDETCSNYMQCITLEIPHYHTFNIESHYTVFFMLVFEQFMLYSSDVTSFSHKQLLIVLHTVRIVENKKLESIMIQNNRGMFRFPKK